MIESPKRWAWVMASLVVVIVASGLISLRIQGRRWQDRFDRGREALAEGRFDDAQGHLRAAVDAARSFGERDLRLAWSLIAVGYLRIAQAKDGEAEASFRQARALLEGRPDGDGADLADCLAGLATV